METLEQKFKTMHLLDREERIKLLKDLKILKPDFLKQYVPWWWWWKRCEVKVLIVCDGTLNFGTAGFHLSEFLTTFNELESTTWLNYKVTLAHRSIITNSPNPVVVNHISNFKFDTSVNLNDFDQVWLFAFNSFGSISNTEINAIETYMDGGGGLFATGDHGSLGKEMCGNIPRVKDMRFWNDAPVGSTNDTNEVSMTGRRRNDTNRPTHGDAVSRFFDNQSDDIPQTIAVRTFGAGMPHPLLSIKLALRASGIIDIMPDHPHEGECAQEKIFTVNGVAVPTQVIATSFVLAGSSAAAKAATDPHCFPSISVWDGRSANAGRIVIDSTWHHFININLNGSGAGSGSGLSTPDFNTVRQYYMNIATWMSRRRFMICWRKYVLYDLFVNSQLIEASLNNPTEDIKDISLADLNSIGALAEEVLASKFNPAFAKDFLLEFMEDYRKEFADLLNVWKPKLDKEKKDRNDYYQNWLNMDLILWTSIGSGFIALRDAELFSSHELSEKRLDGITEVFIKGIDVGFNMSVQNLTSNYNSFTTQLKNK